MRQSAFALMGDLAKVAAVHLMPSTADLLALGVANLQPAMLRAESMSACNNACWSLGGWTPHQRQHCLPIPQGGRIALVDSKAINSMSAVKQ